MPGFIERLKRKYLNPSSREGSGVDPFQRMLDSFQPSPHQREKRIPLAQPVSTNEVENEVNGELVTFRSYVKQIKETSLRLEELAKLFESGEISENAYNLLMRELGGLLSMTVQDFFKLREKLELDRARAKLEWAKTKLGIKEIDTTRRRDIYMDDYISRQLYSPLHRWEEIISEIDSALSSLPIEEEISIIERYLSLDRKKIPLAEGSHEDEGGLSVCLDRLKSVSEMWASTRRERIERIMNLELEVSRTKDEIKEVEVRFSVGELSQDIFERKMSSLQANLKKAEKEISDIREFIDNMDMKIFRCTELLRENE